MVKSSKLGTRMEEKALTPVRTIDIIPYGRKSNLPQPQTVQTRKHFAIHML